ncbi:histone-like nucleoid-structuring protein Lsr2 (plasmid) [Rhodococcus erythropolis]|uniref:histone-like nucleoid-structuring protein Lsr2 n=1 Tax=Rhodococcus erythropolis TaxID=1833 RepID=UPI00406BC283
MSIRAIHLTPGTPRGSLSRRINLLDTCFERHPDFILRGADYLIDLWPTNVDKFNTALEPFVKVAEKVGKARRGSKADATAKDTGSGRSKEQLQAVRDWAIKNGCDVAPRGRVKAEILDAFDAAH